jgi:hypothetical protein
MSLSTALWVLVLWTSIAIVAGLWIARVLRRREQQAQEAARRDFRNSA